MRLFAGSLVLLFTACGTTAHIGRVDVVRDAEKNVTAISSPILLLETAPDELATIIFRCKRAQCSEDDRVTAEIRGDGLVLGRPEKVSFHIGDWHHALPIEHYDAEAMPGLGYRYTIRVEMTLGMLMNIAAEPTRVEVLSIAGKIIPTHREPIEEFVEEVMETRERQRALAAL